MNYEEYTTATMTTRARVETLEPQTTQSPKRARFFETAPSTAFFLDAEDPAGVSTFLEKRRWLEPGESLVSVKVAGQGNMNYLVRVTTSLRTFILKQSRPWVEKYSEIAAPFDRAVVEARFYTRVAGTPAAEFMPKFHWVDEESRILCLEDLGTLGDCSILYEGVPLSERRQRQLYRFLSFLHANHSPLENREMSRLNHFHIFVYPFQMENNLDLDGITPGLQRLAGTIKTNDGLRERIHELGQLYLSGGNSLLHGDFFPGSWLRTKYGVKVIDPEFGFTGPREFDLGVLSAHFQIAGVAFTAPVSETHYAHSHELDHRLVSSFAAVEILRRLLGVAQLPITFDLDRKRSLIEHAVHELQR